MSQKESSPMGGEAPKPKRRMDGSTRSATYRKILDYINNEPRLLGTLYDLNLLPELVEHDAADKRAMLACYFGYRVGKDTKREGATDGR